MPSAPIQINQTLAEYLAGLGGGNQGQGPFQNEPPPGSGGPTPGSLPYLFQQGMGQIAPPIYSALNSAADWLTGSGKMATTDPNFVQPPMPVPQVPGGNLPFGPGVAANYGSASVPVRGHLGGTPGVDSVNAVAPQASTPQAPGGVTSYSGEPDKYYGPPFQTGASGATGAGGGNNPSNKYGITDPNLVRYLDYSYKKYDSQFGQGWTDTFINNNGMDPISFYMQPFMNDPEASGWQMPGEYGQSGRDYLENRADYAAESQGKFLPGAIEEWTAKHGAPSQYNPIPQEQWDAWWKISLQHGGNPMNQGVGQSAYGVY